jgi:acetyl esterase/lipase
MASEASRRIRATLSSDAEESDAPLDVQRRGWEEAAAQAALPSGVTETPCVADGVPGVWVRGANAEPGRALLYLHGGGFTSGSPVTHRELAARLALATALSVLVVDYRLAPEHPFPAAIDDAVAAYRWLLAQGYEPRSIVFGGDSAGTALALSALLALRERALPLPAAAFLISSWVDLTMSGESIASRAQVDPLTTQAGLAAAARLYLADADPRLPLASPLFGDLAGLPPLLLQSGDHEVLLSDATRLAERAAAAGVDVTLEVWDEMWHVWHAWGAELPEAQEAIAAIGRFVRRHLPQRAG